jgi:hypothetical protein
MILAKNKGRLPILSTFEAAVWASTKFHAARPALIPVIWTGFDTPTLRSTGER